MPAVGTSVELLREVWKVASQSHAGGAYFVRRDGEGWHCTWPVWAYRGQKRGEPCKHIRQVTATMATEVG